MPRPLQIAIDPQVGQVSGLFHRPADARAVFAFAHGAGAGMRHRLMETVSDRLVARGIAVLRYQFPYTEAGRRRPDSQPRLLATVRAALDRAAELADGLALFAGGKSMGGRMTSLALSQSRLPAIRGLVFLGFPLHPPDRPAVKRAEHLERIDLPLLFVQGTRDKLADLTLLAPICQRLGERVRLHTVEGADHGFQVLKRSGRTDEQALDEVVDTAASWIVKLAASATE